MFNSDIMSTYEVLLINEHVATDDDDMNALYMFILDSKDCVTGSLITSIENTLSKKVEGISIWAYNMPASTGWQHCAQVHLLVEAIAFGE